MTTKKFNSFFLAGVIMCLMGAVCFSTKAIFVKLAYRDTDVDPITLLALRMLFSLPFFIASAFFSSSQKANVRFTPKQWLAVAAIGCLGYYVSSLLDFLGLQYISAGVERLVLFVYPTIVLVISAILFKTQIKSRQWLALFVTYAGLFIACWPEVNNQGTGDNFWKGSFLIFVCALTYASYIVGSGQLVGVLGSAKFNSYAMSFAAIAVLIHFFIANSNSLFDQASTVYLYSFLMAVLSTVIPSYLVAEGIRRVGSGNAAIIGSVGPISTILQASIFLQEAVTTLQIVGTVLILMGVVVVSQKKQGPI